MANTQSGKLYLLTPPLRVTDLDDFASTLAAALEAGDVACVLARLAPDAEGDAKKIVTRLVEIAAHAGAALLVDNDPRLAARVGADGAHMTGGGAVLNEALASLKPERIVGAGLLRTRDEAMNAGEAGVDYVMFGEPRRDGYTPPADETVERVEWWAEIFEPPCVGYAASLEDIAPLADAGADFVALADAIWSAPAPLDALAQARAILARRPD
ncbi:thiamine phosphate synthase [Methylocapsa sp. S129]|uniref:thiamine phosphate synthase n=1 Tax=Methylocapsa sp. S129 TaxID=1641869 RepID=UPI00131C951F|nr:thiamine phosphate synthase [Methylocapsa sp. S129]